MNTNWAGNYQYQAQRVHRPQSLAEIQEIVSKTSRLKAIGTRHSFNPIADTPADHVSLENLNRVVALDADAQTVTIEGGVRYGDLAAYLHQHGFALHNLASLPHISVTGACATATHGSGQNNGNLATAVRGLEIVTASGEVVTFSREATPEIFAGAVVGLGALGAVTKMTLAVEPAYQMRQYVFYGLPFSRMEAHFDAIQASAYSVSFFTDWQGDAINQVWLKQRADEQPIQECFGARPADDHLHPIPGVDALNCTEQMGIIGAWHERLPHFKMNFTPSSGDELQSEFFVPRKDAITALQAIRALREKITPLLHISEIRTIAADDLWMSPCYEQDCVAIHFTWKPLWEDVQRVLPQIEAALEPMGARPHWGKLFTMDDPGARYAKLDDFRGLIDALDPQRKFSNPFLEAYVYG